MNRDGTEQHPESSASTPNSTGDAGPNGHKAIKDRRCEFCGQAFTSSSLGRHLDLYIRPKNPKQPDGVHDVDEILKIRGRITRRQPRSGTKGGVEKEDGGHSRRGSSGWSSAQKGTTRAEATRIMEASPVASPVSSTAPRDGGMHTVFNSANWQATGVINNLPARAPSRPHTTTPGGQAQRVQEMRRDTTGGRIERPEYVAEDMWKLQESAEVGRAAEMALREVLGSLEAARRKAEPGNLFEEFDFLALAFPGLCLAMLKPPSTLFSSTPFAVAHTWSLEPPGPKQFETLCRLLNEALIRFKDRLGERVEGLDTIAFNHHVHLTGAWEHWQSLSAAEQTATWSLEMARAFERERGITHSLRAALENAQQRIHHLEAEYDRLSRCQLPREYLLHPPNTLPITTATVSAMKHSDLTPSTTSLRNEDGAISYDADTILNHWKRTVRATTRPPRAPPPPPPAPPPQPTIPIVDRPTNANTMSHDIIRNGSVFGINGTLPLPPNPTHAPNSDITPSQPGTVLSSPSPDADADEDAATDNGGDDPAPPKHAIHGPLTRVRSNSTHNLRASVANNLLNVNGKRAFDPELSAGRERDRGGGRRMGSVGEGREG